MYKNKLIFMFCLFSILVIVSGVSFADAPDTESRRVYVIVADKLTLGDIDNMNHIKESVETGGLGMMNSKGSNNSNSTEGFLSINSSSRAYGVSSYSEAFNLTDKKLSLYKKRVGDIEKDMYQVGNMEINRILDANLEDAYNSKIGALGDNIHKNGLKTAVYGNSDTDELNIRMGSLIPMDSRGLVDYGNLDDVLVTDDSYPYGIKTDYQKILTEIKQVSDKASLIVVDTGDLKRLDLYSSYLNEGTFMNHRKNMLDSMDKFIGDLKTTAGPESLFIVVSPSIENERIKESKLSPIMMWKNDDLKQGILTSSTTRRLGIVSNLDIAPTIADFLNVPKDDFVGHHIDIKKSDDNIEFIKDLDQKINLISVLRAPFLKLYNVFTILVIVVSSLFLIVNKNSKRLYRKIVENLLLIVLSIPLALLIMPLLRVGSASLYVLLSILLLGVIVGIVTLLFKGKNRLWTILSLSLIVILIDIATGSNLTKASVIGYDPIIGARYFGIGNELVGVLLASLIIMVSVMMSKLKSKLPLLLLLVSVIVVGLPTMGANVGGTISILFASIIFISLAFKINLNLKRLMAIVLGIGLVILMVGLLDIYVNPNPTHLGETLLMLFKEGPSSIINVIVRKLSVNIRLIKSSSWGKVLYTTLLFMILMFKLFKNRVENIYISERNLDIGFISLIAGSIVGFLVNDSGLLLASISSMFMIVTLMYLIVANREEIWRD